MHLAPYVLLEPGARASQRPKSGKTVLSLSRQPCTPLSVSLTRHQLVGLLTGLNQHSVDISFNFNQHCWHFQSAGSPLIWTHWTRASQPRWPTSSTAPRRSSQSWCFSSKTFRQAKHEIQILTFIRFLSPSWSPTSWLAFSPLPLPLPPCRWVRDVVAIQKKLVQVFFSRSKCQVMQQRDKDSLIWSRSLKRIR